MKVIQYPHPTLRYKSKPIKMVDKDLKNIIAEMFDLMYEHRGIGLAANQVNLPLRLFVVNVAGERGVGDELVFINPVITNPKGTKEMDEGCLSLPGVFGPVIRPEKIRVQAYNLKGELVDWKVDDMLSRVIQHEFDHLNGVLFIDRMPEMAKLDLRDELDEFETDFESRRAVGEFGSDEQLIKSLSEIEQKYC